MSSREIMDGKNKTKRTNTQLLAFKIGHVELPVKDSE